MSDARTARLPDRSSPLPLWAQVCDDLRRRIATEAFEAGFPGELTLTEEYEVSRHTIREALRVLRGEGVLRSSRGRATTVQPPGYRQSLGTLYSLFTTLSSQNVEQRSTVLRLARTTNSVVAAYLDLPAGAGLVVLERLRLADGEPLAHDTSWLPACTAEPLLARDFSRTGLYAELREACDTDIDAGQERVSAVLPPRHIAELLTVSPANPVFRIERRASAGGRAAEWRETFIRGDRFSLETTWTPTQTVLTSSADVTGREQTP